MCWCWMAAAGRVQRRRAAALYVAMTRARRSLTLCEVIDGPQPFTRQLDGLSLPPLPAPFGGRPA